MALGFPPWVRQILEKYTRHYFPNEDPQPVADDRWDRYIADRMHWDTQDSTPQLPCTPIMLEPQPKHQDDGPIPEASPTAEQSSDISISVLGLPESISIVNQEQTSDAISEQAALDTGPFIPLEIQRKRSPVSCFHSCRRWYRSAWKTYDPRTLLIDQPPHPMTYEKAS